MLFFIALIILSFFLSPVLARDEFREIYLDGKGSKLLELAFQKTTKKLNSPDFLSKKYVGDLELLTSEQCNKIRVLKNAYSLQQAQKEVEGLYMETCEAVKKLKETAKNLLKIVYEGKTLKNSAEKSIFFYHVNRLIKLPQSSNQKF